MVNGRKVEVRQVNCEGSEEEKELAAALTM